MRREAACPAASASAGLSALSALSALLGILGLARTLLFTHQIVGGGTRVAAEFARVVESFGFLERAKKGAPSKVVIVGRLVPKKRTAAAKERSKRCAPASALPAG